MQIRSFKKVCWANRGEFAIRIYRACNELGIATVAIYSEEDRTHEHRHKADEAYLVGRGKRPVEAYLGIDEIIDIAQQARADAVHPGYGFLSENWEFAAACEARGLRFIGPRPETVRLMGDKITAKESAVSAGVPAVPGITLEGPEATPMQPAREFFNAHGLVLVKAAHGGGGRGMRLVREAAGLEGAIAEARSESKLPFGSSHVFLGKFLQRARPTHRQLIAQS